MSKGKFDQTFDYALQKSIYIADRVQKETLKCVKSCNIGHNVKILTDKLCYYATVTLKYIATTCSTYKLKLQSKPIDESN